MEIDSGPGPQHVKTLSEYELDAAGLVARTFSLWSRKLPQYIVIVGLTGVALVVLQTILIFSIYGFAGIVLVEFIGTSPLDSVLGLLGYAFPIDVLIIIFILSLVSLVVFAAVAGAAIKYALTDYENPGTADISESFSFAFERVGSLIGVQLLQSLVLLGVASIAIFIMDYDILISTIMIVVVLYLAIRLAPAPAVVIAEDRPALEALSRSWQITGGAFWHVFFGQLLMGIVFLIVSIAISVAVGVGFEVIIANLEMSVLFSTVITSLILSPLNYIYLAVLYKDLEARGTSGEYIWW